MLFLGFLLSNDKPYSPGSNWMWMMSGFNSEIILKRTWEFSLLLGERPKKSPFPLLLHTTKTSWPNFWSPLVRLKV